MRHEQPRKRFLFTDDAVGFNGRITTPREQRIEGQAVASLAVGGGVATSRVEGARFGEFVSVDVATAAVAGRKFQAPCADGSRRWVAATSAAVSLEGFNLMNVVRAGLVTARIAAEHPEDGPEDSNLTILGTGFEDLSIAGRRVSVELHECLFGLDKFSDLVENDHALKLLAECWLVKHPEHQKAPYNGNDPAINREWVELLRNDGPIFCPIVKKVHGLPPGVEANGNTIYIPGFGEVHLGEMFLTPKSRRLTMMRFDLGCTYSGCLCGGDVCDNGSWYP